MKKNLAIKNNYISRSPKNILLFFPSIDVIPINNYFLPLTRSRGHVVSCLRSILYLFFALRITNSIRSVNLIYIFRPQLKYNTPLLIHVVLKNVNLELVQNTLIETIPVLPREWKLSIDINPSGTVSGWSNIFHATTSDNDFFYGYRTPGIWFHSDTTRLYICSVDGNDDYCFSSEPLPFNKWTNVVIMQFQPSGHTMGHESDGDAYGDSRRIVRKIWGHDGHIYNQHQ